MLPLGTTGKYRSIRNSYGIPLELLWTIQPRMVMLVAERVLFMVHMVEVWHLWIWKHCGEDSNVKDRAREHFQE